MMMNLRVGAGAGATIHPLVEVVRKERVEVLIELIVGVMG